MRSTGLMVILSSPSGAGKSSLSRRLLDRNPQMKFSVSATTRAPRAGEEDGTHYYFKTRGEFESLIAGGGMLEYAEVFGNYYGSPRAPVEAAIGQGRDVLFDVDWQGGQQIRNSDLRDNVVSIFILPPSIGELERRLVARGQDSAEVIEGRMRQSMDEISRWSEYDYVLINDDLDRCEADLTAILQAERLRRVRRPGLVGFVKALDAEFAARTPQSPE
ncbi:guanylate kinase [Oceanomicrobium pacificus]|uniref:guanylate kinase n=1 Tax=Oceanomicrobium pacificus TaxID=2692916 RepID=UPI00136E08FE|nr:guanylate kinase [Oceanomicrobium pacificus]